MKTYLKRIWFGQTPDNELLSVYCVYGNSRPIGWRVTKDRKPQRDFESKDAALEYAASLKRGAPASTPTLTRREQWYQVATKLIDAEPVDVSVLEFGLIAAVVAVKGIRKGIDHLHIIQYDKLAEWLYAAELNEVGGEDWCRKALAIVQVRCKAQATFAHRLHKFVKVLDQIALYGAFKPWRGHLSIYPALIKECRADTRDTKPKAVHYRALTWQQIQARVDAEPTPEAATMLIYVLAMGFRFGEQDRATAATMVDGKMRLSDVQKKVKTERTPLIPAVAQICLKLPKEKFSELQRPLRTTCATHLILAGVDPLTVAERLGHASIQMVTKHYAKLSIGHQDYPVSEMKLDGVVVPGNAYDTFLLYCLCSRAAREGWINKIKAAFTPPATSGPLVKLVNF